MQFQTRFEICSCAKRTRRIAGLSADRYFNLRCEAMRQQQPNGITSQRHKGVIRALSLPRKNKQSHASRILCPRMTVVRSLCAW